MKTGDIKKQWADFRESKGHHQLTPVSLVSAKDSTALFNVAGMQQLIPYLMGKKHALGQRLYNIQGCLRTNDIEGIGDERHLAYFEMMGNRSLGDYFKKEAIERSVEFLCDYLHVSKDRIGATIFAGSEKHTIPRDTLSEETLKKAGIHHITAIGFDKNDDSDNFWIAGAEGPCGPCCEFYIDRGDAWGPNDWKLGENDRYTEVRNNVFMEFYKDVSGALTKLSQQNVDTGMGLERIAMILQDKETIFETDIFTPTLTLLEKFFSVAYPPFSHVYAELTKEQHETTRSFRIVTEHLRSTSTLIKDGVLPSNEGRGYVLRRLIRRMYYHMQKMTGMKWQYDKASLLPFFTDAIHIVFPDIQIDFIVDTLIKECLQFQETIQKGQKILDQAMQQATKTGGVLSGDIVFQAYDTYGIPVELMAEVAQERGLNIDMEGYQVALTTARDKSRQATKGKFSKGTDWSAYISDITPTEYVGYDSYEQDSMKLLKDFTIDGKRVLVFDKTPFYAEGGGEISDTGEIVLDNGEKVEIVDVQKSGGVYLHIVK